MRDEAAGGSTRTGMTLRTLAVALAAAAPITQAACFNPDSDCCATDAAPPPPYVEVAAVSATLNRDVDVLFVIDDSPATLHLQTALKTNFPTFVSLLDQMTGGRPNLHIGVISPDLGTKGANDPGFGPGIGSGPGSCNGDGKSGTLQTNGATTLTGLFISDLKNTDGTRAVNYSTTLEQVFSVIASLGASGCGFEQPIEAARRAVNVHPANVGFIRPQAGLAIVMLNDEDDCSLAHSTIMSQDTGTLGPLTSFRCTRFGVTCDDGGKTPIEMNQIGVKSRCRSNEGSAYLTPVAPYQSFFTGLKSDPRQVYVASLSGPPTPVEVELRTPPGGGVAIPSLAHSCQWTDSNGPQVADPGVRLDDFARRFARHTSETICTTDLSPQLTAIARQVRGLAGDTCLVRDIALPADCVVTERRSGVEMPFPSCESSGGGDCYQLYGDTVACTAGGQNFKLDVTRQSVPPPDAVVIMKCKL